MSNPEPLAYSVAETARLLSVSRRTVYNRIDDGTIKHIKLGGLTRVPRIEVERIVREAGPQSTR